MLTTVLSAFPLPRPVRDKYTTQSGHPVRFIDLASVRRGGLSEAFRALRSNPVSGIIVTGENADLPVFRDILVLVSLAIPGTMRSCAAVGTLPVRIRWRDYVLAALRILLGVAIGYSALAANIIRLWLVTNSRSKPVVPGSLRKCLYLKPALNLGAAIGGSVGHVAGVVNAMHRRKQSVCLMAATSQPMIESDVEQVRVSPPSLTAYPNELNLFRYHRKYLAHARRQLGLFRPDFIYQRYSVNDFSGICLRRRTGVPLILEFNGSETWIQRHWGHPLRFQSTAERIEAANLRHADLVVVVSEEIKKQVCAMGVPEERVFFYPNGVDPTVFDPGRFDASDTKRARRNLGVPESAFLLTFVGTFGQWHGTDVLAMAIRRMIDEEPSFLEAYRIHFLLVGDGQYGPKVRSVLADSGSFVTLAGYRAQSETPQTLAASDICLSPHIPNPDGTPFFGSPTKLFEYMAMDKVIVASDLDQIGWVLRGWHPGSPVPASPNRGDAAAILVEPGSTESLIEGIKRSVLMTPEDRSRLAGRARSFVRQFYTWDKNVDAVLNHFEQILRRGATPLSNSANAFANRH